MKKRSSVYILILVILAFIFIWLVMYLTDVYNAKTASDQAIEEYLKYHSINYNDLSNQDIPWQFLISPFFILLTYYFIPYLIFILAFLRNKHHAISRRIQKHNKIYICSYFAILSAFSCIFYYMLMNIMELFELFEYINILCLCFIIYIVIYYIAYLLGKHFACAMNILCKHNFK